MLVNCVAYQNGHKVGDLQPGEIADKMKAPNTFVWVALKDPEPQEFEQHMKEFKLHELAVEDSLRGHQRPKVEEYGESLFVVLHTVELTESGELETGEVDIFVGPNYVLSVRNRTKEGFSKVRERCEQEPELLKNGSAFVLYTLMDTIVDRYFPIVDQMERELEAIEDRIFSKTGSVRLNIEELYHLKRKLMVLLHGVAPLVEASSKLFGGRVPAICNPMQDYFRDVYDHLIRISRSIESIREMTVTAIQVNLSLIMLNESEVTKKLASYGSLFAVPTAVAGIYGMNFKSMPELNWEYGYPLVILIIVLADIGLWFKFRRAGWL